MIDDGVTQLIQGARDFLSNPSQWCQGSLGTADTSVCALGALWATAENLKAGSSVYEAEDEVEKHLPQKYLEKGSGGKLQLLPIAAFNDDPETTHQDVLNLFDKALADLGGLG